MKQVYLPAIQITIMCVAAAGCISAQTANTVVYTATVQKAITNEQADEVIDKEVRKSISMKAVRHFKMKYGKVRGEKWWRISSGFVSGFTVNGVKHSIYYDPKGGWLQSCRWYDESGLAADIKSNITRCYEGYDIVMVAEIEYPGRLNILVQLKHRETKQAKIITYNDGVQQADE